MTTRFAVLPWVVVLLVASAAWPAVGRAQKVKTDHPAADAPVGPPQIWRDPGEMTALNLIDGAGGRADAPDPAGPICMSWRRTNSFEAPDAAPLAAIFNGLPPSRTEPPLTSTGSTMDSPMKPCTKAVAGLS